MLDEFTGGCKVIGTFVDVNVTEVLLGFALGSVKRHQMEFIFCNYDNSSFGL